ncbi:MULTISPECIES: hypothetical protein [Streptomyces]|uniref:hypothetical protein n=1 Tax=Streptomyces TaxID=1883 RepID=UPI001906335C|nr:MULTISPECIES: hypothetical protein [unclassified Streptomyces]MCU4747164.1 hypothetical protein [Streptomyces sp. G-5]QQN77813.1 hypothetical protein IPZ77_10465 [Streptomyces sp. XC 2026]
MTADAIAGLRQVHARLKSIGADTIPRPHELEAAAEKVLACSAELGDVAVAEPEEVRRLLAYAVKSLRAAEKAAHAHHSDPAGRPLAPVRFALKAGSADGALEGALELLDPGN